MLNIFTMSFCTGFMLILTILNTTIIQMNEDVWSRSHNLFTFLKIFSIYKNMGEEYFLHVLYILYNLLIWPLDHYTHLLHISVFYVSLSNFCVFRCIRPQFSFPKKAQVLEHLDCTGGFSLIFVFIPLMWIFWGPYIFILLCLVYDANRFLVFTLVDNVLGRWPYQEQ